jgi:hypothetical protein
MVRTLFYLNEVVKTNMSLTSSRLIDVNLPLIMAWLKRSNPIDPPAYGKNNSDYMFEAAGTILSLRSHPPSEEFHLTLATLYIFELQFIPHKIMAPI